MSHPTLRVVFLGSDPIALPMLDWLVTEGRTIAQVVAVFTQPDRPVGRGQRLAANGIKLWATEQGLPVHQPEKLDESARKILAEYRPDLSLVMAYGHILRDDFIGTPRLGTVNLHASILPKFRGASPIQSAVASGERETGVTLMRIVRALDAGPVADVERLGISPLDTALDIETKMALSCVPLIRRSLPRLAEGTLTFVEQDHARATYCRRLQKEDGVLDFHASAQTLAARINGLFPWPGCAFEVAGVNLKVGLAEVGTASADANPPGCVVGADEHGLLVATGDGVLKLLRLQKPGGRMISAPEFLRGFPLLAGTVLSSWPMPPIVADRPFR